LMVFTSMDCFQSFQISSNLELIPSAIDTAGGRLLLLRGSAPISGDPTAPLVSCDVSEPAFIDGSAFADLDSSCSQNGPADTPVGRVKVRITDDFGQTYYVWTSNNDGTYAASVQPGRYTVSVVHTDRIQETCANGSGLIYDVTLAGGQTSSGNNFSLTFTCAAGLDFESIYPLCDRSCLTRRGSSVCPGCPERLCVTYGNLGTGAIQNPGGLLTMDLPSLSPTICNNALAISAQV